jgi:hypothetical protein
MTVDEVTTAIKNKVMIQGQMVNLEVTSFPNTVSALMIRKDVWNFIVLHSMRNYWCNCISIFDFILIRLEPIFIRFKSRSGVAVHSKFCKESHGIYQVYPSMPSDNGNTRAMVDLAASRKRLGWKCMNLRFGFKWVKSHLVICYHVVSVSYKFFLRIRTHSLGWYYE